MPLIRFPDDVLDRIWFPSTPVGSRRLSSSSASLSRNSSSSFRLPQVVMRTAIIPDIASGSVDFGWTPEDPSLEFYFYMYFTELQEPSSNSGERREFVIFLNGESFSPPLNVTYLRTTALFSLSPLKANSFEFSIRQTRDSTRPPLINAMETYFAKKFPQSSTDQNDRKLSHFLSWCLNPITFSLSFSPSL